MEGGVRMAKRVRKKKSEPPPPKKVVTKALHINVELDPDEKPDSMGLVSVKVPNPTGWGKVYHILTHKGNLYSPEGDAVRGCKECITDHLKQVRLRTMTLKFSVTSRKECPSEHGAAYHEE